MNEVWDFFRELLDTSDFPPRWHCGNWTQFHGWLYLLSDLAIWAAYFAIPFLIMRYLTRKQNARFIRIFVLFAAFILACGATHFLDALAFWLPLYRLSALVRLATAIISWITVFNLIKFLPIAFSQKTPEQLEEEIEYRKQMEEQLKVNNRLLIETQEIARIGHWQWDVATNKVTWSSMTLKLFGLQTGDIEMTYDEYLGYIHPDDRQFVHDCVTQGFQNKALPQFYHRIVQPGGQVKIMLSRGEVQLNHLGEVLKMTGTVQDITDQRNTEHELLIKTQKLEASNIELQKFASIASHDLREPLRKIITFGSMLDKEAGDALNEKSKMYLQKMTSSSIRMQKLIDDILDFSKLTVNEQVFSAVNLNDVLANVLSDTEIAISKANATITIGKLPTIEANASQMGQLFQNLISNAIKFSKPGQPPEITVQAQTMSGGELRDLFEKGSNYNFTLALGQAINSADNFTQISVSDNGIGFDEAYLDRIFLIFQRLHDKSAYEGTGIGLAVCKKIVELHNGYITAHSQLGKGTTFIIVLPLFHAPVSED